MSQVYIAVGSNVDAIDRMRQAAQSLKKTFGDTRFSDCFSNPAFGFTGPDFINAVAGFRTELSIAQVLQALHEIEAQCGRLPADPKWGPRAMDLDLLLYEAVVGSGPGYTLPRPDLLKRAYMLGPLAQLAPDYLYPPAGPTIAQLWRQFPVEHALLPLELNLNAA